MLAVFRSFRPRPGHSVGIVFVFFANLLSVVFFFVSFVALHRFPFPFYFFAVFICKNFYFGKSKFFLKPSKKVKFSKKFTKAIAILNNICYNISETENRGSVIRKKCVQSCPCSNYFFFEGVFMRNEKKADRAQEHL